MVTSTSNILFRRLRGTGPAAGLADLLRPYDPAAIICAATDPGTPGEAWLETTSAELGVSTLEELCQTQGWEVQDALAAIPLVTLVNPTPGDLATHRLYLHYAANEPALADLDAWYVEEHEEMLFRSPAWRRIRRFRIESATGPERLVVHDVADPGVLRSPELRVAMDTPRRRALARTDWFGRSSRQTWRILDSVPGDTPLG